MKIVKGRENPILRTVSKPVPEVTKKVAKLVKDMEPVMFKAQGVGLAAPQIGLNTRVVLCVLGRNRVVPMINPEILWKSEETETYEEGCLSLPGLWKRTERHKSLQVRYLDKYGKENILKLEGLDARVVQHEVDHLNAILFVDRAEGKVKE